MKIAFLPISLESISPTIGGEDALHRLSGGPRDHALYVDGGGDIRWRHKGKLLTPEEYEAATRDSRWMFEQSALALLSALRGGQVIAYIWSAEQRACFAVPRFYWNGRRTFDIAGEFDGMEGVSGTDNSMVGQAFLFSEDRFEVWAAKAKAQIQELRAANDDCAKPTVQTRPKPGWYPLLEMIFEEECKKRDNWSETHPHMPIPPEFPNAATFQRLLVAKYPRLKDRLKARTVRHHVEALRAAHNR